MQDLILQAFKERDDWTLKNLEERHSVKDLLRYEEQKEYLISNGKRSFTIEEAYWYLKMYVFPTTSIPGGKPAIFKAIKKMIAQKKAIKQKDGEYRLIF